MAESVLSYVETTLLSLSLFGLMCFIPGIILFVAYKYCTLRCKNNQSLPITIIVFALAVVLSAIPICYILLKYEEGPFDIIIYSLIVLPYTMIGCSFLIVPMIFLFLFIIRKIEKRDITTLKKPFLIIEVIAIILGIVTAIVMIKNY